jgi:NADH:ubiquinone oxidoreductase subunit 3 (subunit A)
LVIIMENRTWLIIVGITLLFIFIILTLTHKIPSSIMKFIIFLIIMIILGFGLIYLIGLGYKEYEW